MNAVEIEEAISQLAEQPFDAQEFPFAFLEAFGNKATTIKRLRAGSTNKSDIGGVLQTGNCEIRRPAELKSRVQFGFILRCPYSPKTGSSPNTVQQDTSSILPNSIFSINSVRKADVRSPI